MTYNSKFRENFTEAESSNYLLYFSSTPVMIR